MKHRITLILLFSLMLNISAISQKKDVNNSTKRDELSLAEESYKASLTKLLEIHENDLKQAKAILETRQRQYERGEITKDALANTEKFVAEAESRVTRTKAEISKLEIT